MNTGGVAMNWEWWQWTLAVFGGWAWLFVATYIVARIWHAERVRTEGILITEKVRLNQELRDNGFSPLSG